MIKAQVIADSTSNGSRITTMVVTMPRIILAEFNTHRMFSRNSASSRAIPFHKMVKAVKENPFVPIAWQKDHIGMQGTEYFTEEWEIAQLKDTWLYASDMAIENAQCLHSHPLSKQLCNRLLEPFMWHTVICTSTEWSNFFNLRCPQYRFDPFISGEKRTEDALGLGVFKSKKDLKATLNSRGIITDDYTDLSWLLMNKGQAEIHMMALAEAMWDAMNESQPKNLKEGEWHIPFGDQIEMFDKDNPDDEGLFYTIKHKEPAGRYSCPDDLAEREVEYKIKIATARCARVSYTVVGEEGKKPNYENDIKLHDSLAKSGHWSPFEHCAQAMKIDGEFNPEKEATDPCYSITRGKVNNSILGETEYGWCDNFRGFIPYRRILSNQTKTVNEITSNNNLC